jgi:hypothetical protein
MLGLALQGVLQGYSNVNPAALCANVGGFVPGRNSVTSRALTCSNISNYSSAEPSVAYMNGNPTLPRELALRLPFQSMSFYRLLIVPIVKEVEEVVGIGVLWVWPFVLELSI